MIKRYLLNLLLKSLKTLFIVEKLRYQGGIFPFQGNMNLLFQKNYFPKYRKLSMEINQKEKDCPRIEIIQNSHLEVFNVVGVTII
ncbi:MAG: hypothetical protein A3B16_02870 [Candidatus Zambryskibacteria bacterium RIFCSPLOWO2_01_FULL_45_43]|uniref:Uncharacterized protein n=2 Tax=Parcubacteria group TaxID=1794811 RepID=A0A1G1ZTZ3_9BACT|nr:MAG: hypothetical protein A3H63_00615 [Candidatus Harrisonbacteria bacterium RIFCSPLOWO2_02_FULL_45_10c]OHB06218.1 MAG: hypothetical protein A3B16_02870 [Candidatus Zambryskibacteria bacterium RIFCSPLOWO2_01_FULL_45_43]